MSLNSIIIRDENRVTYQRFGAIGKKSITLTGNNETVTVPLYRVYGNVEIVRLYGVVTTAIGAATNSTKWTLSDDTTSTDISATGVDISGRAAGTLIIRRGLTSNALVLAGVASASVTDPGTVNNKYLSTVFIGSEKTGGSASYINFVYATTSTPTSGAIDFYCGWVPLEPGARVEIL